jgi:hypothetical protein
MDIAIAHYRKMYCVKRKAAMRAALRFTFYVLHSTLLRKVNDPAGDRTLTNRSQIVSQEQSCLGL